MGVLVACITLSASLAAFALSSTHPSAACYLYRASTADSFLSPGVCITLSASLPASIRLTIARTLRYRHPQRSSQRPYSPFHLKTCILTLLCTLKSLRYSSGHSNYPIARSSSPSMTQSAPQSTKLRWRRKSGAAFTVQAAYVVRRRPSKHDIPAEYCRRPGWQVL